jgi:hypothetical protein
MENTIPLDEQILRSHLEGGLFQSGVALQKWQLISIDWPYVLISVSAAAHEGWPSAYDFRFECSNYPDTPVTAQPWDLEHDAPLDPSKWPGGKSRVPKVFNPDWKAGQCLYLPCDRISLEGHADWYSKHAHLIWKSTSDITLYLEAIYELLNSSDYTGPRSA